MNLPNKLTVIRIILVPFFVAAILIDFPFNYLWALIIFAIASITDMLDGKIARKKNLITDFGKFADPLADKILVLAALLCFVQNGLCDCIAVILILFREFSVTSIRLTAAANGKVVSANIWGKIKTVSQMSAIVIILLLQFILELINTGIFGNAELYYTLSPVFIVVGYVLVWISTVFSIISGVIYILQNKHFINEK